MKNTTIISERDKAYFCRLNRNLVFSELNRYYAHKAATEGLTQRKIADRLNKDYGQVSRLLSEPRNLTLDSVSELLLAMDSEMHFEVVPTAETGSIDEFMNEFEAWSQRNYSLGATNIVYFIDRSSKSVETPKSATNSPVAASSFGDSDGQQAVG